MFADTDAGAVASAGTETRVLIGLGSAVVHDTVDEDTAVAELASVAGPGAVDIGGAVAGLVSAAMHVDESVFTSITDVVTVALTGASVASK